MHKVGIFSGSFDPIHDGHLELAETAIAQMGLDKVFFLVEPEPRRKQGVKAMQHRLAMVRLAIHDNPKFGSITLTHSQFTIQNTLPILQERFKGVRLYLLMGDEVVSHVASWPHIESLVEAVEIVVAPRLSSRREIDNKLRNLNRTRGLKLKYVILDKNLHEASSTAIRMAIKKNQKPQHLKPAVLKYIRQNHLYALAEED